MSIVQRYNQAINQRFQKYLTEAKHAFQAIASEANPLFLKAVDKLLQLDYETVKAEMIAELIESCAEWLNDEEYKNTPMNAILFEHDYTYLDNVEALTYGVVGDLSGYNYDFANGMEAHTGISLMPYTMLSFIDEDYATLSEAVGFGELNDLFGSYSHLLVQESFAAFAQLDIFKKIARKPIFFMALGEHDMDETRLYYVCEDEAIFKAYLTDIENELAGIESKKTIEKKYAALKYRVDDLLDVLVFSNDDTQIDVILNGLQELIDDSPEHKYWAMAKLGSLYVSGKGVKRDIKKARQYFDIVIDHGKDFEKRQACMLSAGMYYGGKGVVKNLLKAHQLITIAHNIGGLSGRFLTLKNLIEKEINELKN